MMFKKGATKQNGKIKEIKDENELLKTAQLMEQQRSKVSKKLETKGK